MKSRTYKKAIMVIMLMISASAYANENEKKAEPERDLIDIIFEQFGGVHQAPP